MEVVDTRDERQDARDYEQDGRDDEQDTSDDEQDARDDVQDARSDEQDVRERAWQEKQEVWDQHFRRLEKQMEDWMEDHNKRNGQPREKRRSHSREKKGLLETMKRIIRKFKVW